MIDLSKIQFTEKKMGREYIAFRGELRVTGEIVADTKKEISKHQSEHFKQCVREMIWRGFYHDLMEPLADLKLLAQRYTPPERYSELNECIEKLNSLFTQSRK